MQVKNNVAIDDDNRISIQDAADMLQINRTTIYRWHKDNLLINVDNRYDYDGIIALKDALSHNKYLPKTDYQQIYTDNSKITQDASASFSVSETPQNGILSIRQSQQAFDQLNKLGAKWTYNQKDGTYTMKPLIVTYIAYLKARFGDKLVADKDTGQLWLMTWTADEFNLQELPNMSNLMADASANWNIDEVAGTEKRIQRAMEEVVHQVPNINPFEIRLEMLEKNWDGKHRLDTVFKTLFNSPQEPDVLKAIAHSWFNGAIHNWTREPHELVYPMMLDINATSQGIGKSFFFNVINGVMLGHDGPVYSGVEGDLNDPANIYPQLLNKAVVNDDEHRVYNASQPFGKQNSGIDVNATYKNWITLNVLEWTPKHSNEIRHVLVRYVLGRTSNVAKPYNDNDTSEIDRRYLTVRGGSFQNMQQQTVEEYTHYIEQILGEAKAMYQWNESTDANMSQFLRKEMAIEQLNGSKQADGLEFITEIMNRQVSLNFFAGKLVDIQSYLAGMNEFESTNWKEVVPVKNMRYVRPRAIAGALFKMAQTIGTKMTKDQSESLTLNWLDQNNFVTMDKTDFKWHNNHYQGDFMENVDNDQYANAQINYQQDITELRDSLKFLNPIQYSKKKLVTNLKTTNEILNKLPESVYDENPSLIKDAIKAMHETMNVITQP